MFYVNPIRKNCPPFIIHCENFKLSNCNGHSSFVSHIKAMVKEFWNSFQLFLGKNNLPSFLVEILKLTGYDSPISIELLDRERIVEIEVFIETNYGCAHNLFKSTVYENREEFRFLPGHATLLLGLKTYAHKYLNSGLKKKKVGQIQDLSPIPEQVEVLSTNELDKLKTNLIQKITKFCKKKHIDTENLSNSCIEGDLEIIVNRNGVPVYKAIFSCPICEVKTPCLHNTYWQVSNLEKHIQIHQPRKPQPEVVDKLKAILVKKI